MTNHGATRQIEWMNRLLVSSAMAGLLVGCALATAEPLGGQAAPLIYGEDTRLDVHELKDELLRGLSLHSTLALLTDTALERRPDGRTAVIGEPLGDLLNLCAGEPFRSQP